MTRKFLLILAMAFATSGAGYGWLAAQPADDYPNRTIRLVVPFPPGGQVDASARVIADEISKSLRVPVVVENRAGAGGVTGTASVARAEPDGYTFLFGSPIPLLLATHKDLPFTLGSFAAVAPVNKFGHVLATGPTLQMKTLAALVQYAKQNQEKLNYATTGYGSVTHLGAERLVQALGIKAVSVSFRGNAEAVTSLLNGSVQFTLLAPYIALPLFSTNKIDVLAAMDVKRNPWFPTVPSMSEIGYRNLVVEHVDGIVAPAGTPDLIVEKASHQIAAALRNPDVVSRFHSIYSEVALSSARDYQAAIVEENKTWNEVMQSAGLELQ